MIDQTEVTAALVVVARAHPATLSPSARTLLLADLAQGYCAACGYSVLTGRICHCESDE